MKVKTKPIETEAWRVKSLCAWHQKRQMQGMPEPIARAVREGRMQFMGDCVRVQAGNGYVLADWDDWLVLKSRGAFEAIGDALFTQRFEVAE